MPTKQTFKNIAGKFFTITFKDFVDTFTFTFTSSSTYDPLTGNYSDIGTNHNIECIRLNHESNQFDGERIKIGDIKLISRYDTWNALSVAPQVEDTTVVVDGESHQIVDIKLDAANALYTMNCRRL
jgi:hypothetical protein